MARVIFEGSNNSGKTTLAMRFADHWGLAYYRKRTMAGVPAALMQMCTDPAFDDAVVDRAWLSEVHYSEVKGRTPAISRTDLYHLAVMANCKVACQIKLANSATEELTDQSRLYARFIQPHWSEINPDRTALWTTDPKRMTAENWNDIYDELCGFYRREASEFDTVQFPKLLGNLKLKNRILIFCTPNTVLYDTLFLAGVCPCDVTFCPANLEYDSADVQDYLEPAITLRPAEGRPNEGVNWKLWKEKLDDSIATAKYKPTYQIPNLEAHEISHR